MLSIDKQYKKPRIPAHFDKFVRQKVTEIRTYELKMRQVLDLSLETLELKSKLSTNKESIETLLPYAYALVCEAAMRTLLLWPHDTQLIAAIALYYGYIIDMQNGEGKTLAATMPLYLNALQGKGAHLITSNVYLAKRDALWMSPIFRLLGLSVGIIQDNEAFVVKTGEQDELTLCDRSTAYKCDVVYLTLNAVIFDYLRDHRIEPPQTPVQQGLIFAIVDEVDVNLIDRADQAWSLTYPNKPFPDQAYKGFKWVADQLILEEDYRISDWIVQFTENGINKLDSFYRVKPIFSEKYPGIVKQITQAILVKEKYKQGVQYIIRNGKAVIIDQITHFLLPEHREYSDGLQQAIQAKENLLLTSDQKIVASITTQNFFKLYWYFGGMSGTSKDEANELARVYGHNIFPVPSFVEYLSNQPDAKLQIKKNKDSNGDYFVFVRPNDLNKPIFFKRRDYSDSIFRTSEARIRAVIESMIYRYCLGQPMLIGTTSVNASEKLSVRLSAIWIRKLIRVILLRKLWFKANNVDENGKRINDLVPLETELEQLKYSELFKLLKEIQLKSKNIHISLSLSSQQNIAYLAEILDIVSVERLVKVLKFGMPHKVLNAKNHEDEAIIVKDAGRFGAVTVITNVAGLGVDIKLGGDPPKQELYDLTRLLLKEGFDATKLNIDEKLEMLTKLPENIQESQKDLFNKLKEYQNERVKVKSLGGLAVYGIDRRISRRLDNQLRGRAARQGDPGETKFYLSLQDEIMLSYGGGATTSKFMQFWHLDDAIPLENKLVSKLIENVQLNSETIDRAGRNSILEYDRVLDDKRKRVYQVRDELFQVVDFSSEILPMIEVFTQQLINARLRGRVNNAKLTDLRAYLSQKFPLVFPESVAIPSQSKKFIQKFIYNAIEERYQQIGVLVGKPFVNIQKLIFINVLDKSWILFLHKAEVIRRNLTLVAYSETERLVWYAQEIGKLFDNFANDFNANLIEAIMKLPAKQPMLVITNNMGVILASDYTNQNEQNSWIYLNSLLSYLGESIDFNAHLDSSEIPSGGH